jgi:hypothetical protein
MLPAAVLLEDTLTFLAFLHSHDVRLRGGRWLTPTALRDLNAQLIERDQVAPRTRQQGGKRGTVERDTQHLRFIHFLCEAAHLVAKTGDYLKPTLRVKSWLTAEPFEQLQQIFVAAYPDQPSRPHDDLWRTYRLPGWTIASPTTALVQPLFNLVRVAPPDEKIKLTTLHRLIPLPEDGDESPGDIIHGLLDQLAALSALDWHGHAVRLTDIGICLIHPDTPVPVRSIQPSATLQLARQRYPLARTDFATLYQLSAYAELVAVRPHRRAEVERRAGVERRYQLDRALIQRALQRGHSLDGLLRFLEHALGDALPAQLVSPLHRWAAELDRVAVRRVTLLEVKDPATLTELTRAHRVRESIQRTLSPRAVVVRDSRLPALLRQLDRRGLTPRTNLPAAQLSNYRTHSLPNYDTPTLAQLYFAALLNQHLADHLPAPYRVDYSLVLELERVLTPSDRLLAIQLAEEAQDMLNAEVGMRNVPAPSAESSSNFHLPKPNLLSSSLALIKQAIAVNTPLTLTYYSPAYDQTTHRIVEPLRLEWHGEIPYLVAYCRLRQDERTFRVDRIANIALFTDLPAP